jgi:ornithine cyclodeaminase
MHLSVPRAAHLMFILGEREVAKALNLKECLEINRQALITVSERTSYVPTRLGLSYPNHPDQPRSTTGEAQDWTLIKPAAYYGETQNNNNNNNDLAMGMKVISIRAQNPANGLPLTPATILLVDPVSGLVDSTVAGTSITVARTSAGPALAVQAFRPDVQHLVVFGAGAQAMCHIELIQLAIQRRIPKITIINRTRDRAERLKSKLLLDTSDQEIDIILLSDRSAKNHALATADVVAATTNTADPLFEDGGILQRGCLITGIGSYTPDMKEIPTSAVDRCHVVIDTPEAMAVGDLKHLGTLETTHHPITMAGDAWKNPSTVGKETDCIFYKAVGTAIQDVLTTRAVVERAKQLGLGLHVDMS